MTLLVDNNILYSLGAKEVPAPPWNMRDNLELTNKYYEVSLALDFYGYEVKKKEVVE